VVSTALARTDRTNLGLVPVRGENALVRVVVTRIEQDGTMQRRVVDTAQCDDCLQWGRLAARALEFPPPYRPVPGIAVYHVSIGEQVILVAEHDLGGPLLNLVTGVLALGEELLAQWAVRRTDHGMHEQRFELARMDTAGNPPEAGDAEPLSLLRGSPTKTLLPVRTRGGPRLASACGSCS